MMYSRSSNTLIVGGSWVRHADFWAIIASLNADYQAHLDEMAKAKEPAKTPRKK